MSFTEYLHLL